MPGVTYYLTDPNASDRGKIKTKQEDAYRSEHDKRVKWLAYQWDGYEGRHIKHLVDDGTNTDDNVVFNVTGLVIDKGVSDLVGTTETGVIEGPKFDIVGDSGEKPTIIQRLGRAFRPDVSKSPEQLWLDRTWEVNNKELFLHNMALTSGVTGHNFIKVIPDYYPNSDDTEKPLPRLVLLNPAHVTAFWDEGDKATVRAYRIQYGHEGSQKRQDIVWESERAAQHDDGTESVGRWVVYDYEQKNSNKWIFVKETVWEYSWPPIVQWQNLPDPNDFYGCGDVSETNRKLNDSLNFTNSNIQRIIKYHADPKTIGTGIKPEDVLATAIDRFLAIQQADAKVFNLEMSSDLSSSMNFANTLRRGFFDGTRELDPATVEDRLGDLTNFGLRVLFGDKVKKTGTKRMMCGMGLTDINQRILELGGFGVNRKVTIKWPDVLPSDPVAQSTALDTDTKHGLSQESYLEKRGYDAELEAMRRENDIAEGALRDTVGRQGALVDRLRIGQNRGAPNGQS